MEFYGEVDDSMQLELEDCIHQMQTYGDGAKQHFVE